MCIEPQQQLLLEVVYEYLENAGLSLAAVNGHKMGCFVGYSESSMTLLLLCCDIDYQRPVNLKITRNGKHRTEKIGLHSKKLRAVM